ncbi:MAG TPA: pitrilysin family protein [Bacteroidales bacterium]|jgi:Predicted Zn-dependent peptidases
MTRIDRSQAPALQAMDNFKVIEPGNITLDNGIPLYVINKGTQELVRISLVFGAGAWYEDLPFTAQASNLMLREGTSLMASAEIEEKLDFYGAFLETAVEQDNSYISLYSLNKHVHELLPLLRDIIREASFPEKEFEIMVGRQKQYLAVNEQKVNYLARTRFSALIYGPEHPYGTYRQSSHLENINVAALKAFHNQHYTPGNCRIVVAGKVSDELIRMLNDTLGNKGWKNEFVPGRNFSSAADAELKCYLVRKDTIQAAIRIGKQLFNRTHPDFLGMQVLNTVLGGYFGSRLMTNLREDKGYTYGVGSALISLQHAGSFFITSEVDADVAHQAATEVYGEIDRLRNDLVSDSELQLVKNYMLGKFLRSIDGPFAMADMFMSVLESGLNMSYFNRYTEVIRSITASELRELACKHLDPATFHEIIVGK